MTTEERVQQAWDEMPIRMLPRESDPDYPAVRAALRIVATLTTENAAEETAKIDALAARVTDPEWREWLIELAEYYRYSLTTPLSELAAEILALDFKVDDDDDEDEED